MMFGFAAAGGTLEDVRRIFSFDESWQVRDGEGRNDLRPLSQAQAPPRSLSATYGLGAQPLHTDGAHLASPPDIIVLHAAEATPTATVVWRPSLNDLPLGVTWGLFTVRARGHSSLGPAWDGQRFVYDPGCMSPADHLAKEAATFFDANRAAATVHEWTAADQLLFIDNRRALHARNAVIDPERRVSRLALNIVRSA